MKSMVLPKNWLGKPGPKQIRVIKPNGKTCAIIDVYKTWTLETLHKEVSLLVELYGRDSIKFE